MALKVGDRVRENTSSTGVGGLSLTGAPAGFQRFSAVLASGDTTYYTLEENDKFEIGIGTYGSNNLNRTTVLSSSNSGNKISLGGSGIVFITYPADRAVFENENTETVIGASGIVFSDNTLLKSSKLVSLSDVSLSGTPANSTVFDLNITNKALTIGDMTGPSNNENVLVGYGAGSGITTASYNVVIGSQAAVTNKTGIKNVYVGSRSGPTASDASIAVYSSVAVGYSAGNKMRHESVAVGYESAKNSYNTGFVGLGYQAGEGLGDYSNIIGYQAGKSLGENYAIALGYRAGYNGAGESAIWIGQEAGSASTGSTKSIGIGKSAGESSSGTECIYLGEGAGTSNSTNNLIFIGNATPSSNGTLIKGDMDNKRVAVGAADITLSDTFFVGVGSANDEGVVVKAAVSQVSNLTSWKDSSSNVLASVSKNGTISAFDLHSTGNGIQISSITPASTSNRLYNVAGTLYFNGSQLASAGGASSTAQYASGLAITNEGRVNYASGQAIANESDIVAVSGIAAYASGVGGGGGDVTTAQLNYVSGIAVYSSGQTIANQSNITALLAASGTATSLISSSGIAAYASGQAVSNQSAISTNTSRVVYASGQAIANEGDIFAVSGIAVYASGNLGTGDVTTAQLNYVSGIAVYASGHVHDDLYVSGVASYASGQAISNQSSISTNSSNISTNTGNISSNTAKVNYASGQAIENESDIAALLTASGTATSLIASSGIANYASGQAVSNQANITTNAGNITYVSGVATNKFTVTAADSSNYTIDGMGLNSATDPSIYLHKGHTYYFDKQTSSHPFRVSTSNGGTAYQDADGNSIEISGQGTLKFEVPQNAPDKLYYYCTSHASMNGVIYTTNNVDEIIHVSGIAAYASGQATSLNTASGIATYASGQAIANEGDLVAVSGIAAYASGVSLTIKEADNSPNVSNVRTIVVSNGTLTDNGGGQVTLTTGGGGGGGDVSTAQLNYVSGIAVYASGQSQSLNTVSGVATSLVASSGIATYASGQAVANQSSATTNASNISTNTGNISTNTARVSYASGQAISNQGDITAMLSASGTATSLIASSGIANYASGQAVANESDIAALLTASGTATSLIASSGIASYASGQAVSNQSSITALNTASGIATSLLSVSGTATSLVASSGIATYASGNTQNIAFGSNAEGDILIHNGSKFTRLAKGTDDYILKMNGNLPNWEAESGGSSLTAGSGVVVDGASKINIHGGTGNLQEIQLTSNNIFTPKMIFTGSGVQDTPVTMKVLSSHGAVNTSGTALSFEGTQGQLFGITDNLSSGNIFSVADITGLPLISADASGDVKLGEYGRYVGVGTGVPLYGFDVSSSGQFQKGFVLSNYVPATTTNTLYNEGGTLKFNGAATYAPLLTASGAAVYASGQVNVSAAGTATASKALVLDSAKSFTGTKHGVFNEFDSRVTASGVTIGASGITLTGGAYVQEAVPANDTPTTEDATITLDLLTGNYHNVILGNNVTKFEFTNAKRGQRFLLRITQHASSAKTVAWTNVDYTTGGAAAAVRWAGGGTAPTMSTSTSHTDVYGFLCTNNTGSAFDGFVVGQNLPD